jgi:dipeptidyl aminopeptidase/acylaminoacyl peptidase
VSSRPDVRKLAALLAGALLLRAGALAARNVTIDDLMRLRTIVDARISPDGRRVAYATSTPSLERNAQEGAIFVVAAEGGTPLRLAPESRVYAPRVPTPRLRWSPDGTRVSFLAEANGKAQVHAVPASGGGARALTAAPEGVASYEWSPGGETFFYLARDSAPEAEQRRRKEGSFVMRADARTPATRLWRQDLDGKPARALTPPDRYVDSFSLSADGATIAFSASPVAGFSAQYETRIFAIPAAGGASRPIVDRPGMNTAPRYSPDGRWIAFVTTSERARLTASRSLAVVPADGSARPRVFPLDDAWVSDILWAPDGLSVLLLTTDGSFGRRADMFDQPIVRVRLDDGRAERIVAGVNYAPSASADGKRLAFRHVEARTMGDVFVLDAAGGKPRACTDVNPELRALDLGALAPFPWKSSDGAEIWGLLLTPPRRKEGERVPVIVYCHGGPGGGVTYGIFPQFMHTVGQVDFYPAEAMASAGYAVFFPMPRGGSGYGEAGQRAIVGAWGEVDYRDIMAGVDALVARGIADPDRLGVMGASYGGYLTDWIVTQTGRFKAASAGESICDLADLYLLSDGGEFLDEYFGRPWEAAASYAAHSPITHVRNVTTPLLIQHGELDVRTPIAGAWKFYRALKGLGKTVELDVYPGASHLYYAPVTERESMTRNLEWFERWIPASRESRR